MAKISLIVAAILVVVGVAGYGLSGAASVTALIPAFIGILIGICGALALKEKLRMHAMHGAVLFGLVGLIGSGMRIPKVIGKLDETEGFPFALASMSLTAIVLLVFVVLCVKSFIDARRSKPEQYGKEA